MTIQCVYVCALVCMCVGVRVTDCVRVYVWVYVCVRSQQNNQGRITLGLAMVWPQSHSLIYTNTRTHLYIGVCWEVPVV